MNKIMIIIAVLLIGFSVDGLSTARPPDIIIDLCDGMTASIWTNHASLERCGWGEAAGYAAGNYQCYVPNQSACNKYDWMVKSSIQLSDPSNPATSAMEINTYLLANHPEYLDANYGLNQSIIVAGQSGITLPVPSSSPELFHCYSYNGTLIWW